MVIDVKRLKYAGKDECSFCFEYQADNSLITLPGATFAAPVTVTGTLRLAGGDVYVEGELSYELDAHCSRCLKETKYFGHAEFDEDFSEDADGEDDRYPFSKGLVDLTKMVNDTLILSFPYVVYCDEDKEEE